MARTKASEASGLRTRDRILSAGLEVFSANGFRGGSLDQVAERAGVTRGALLYHFRSKEGLLVELLSRRDTDVQIMQESPLPATGAPTADLLATIRVRSPIIRAAIEEMKLAHVLEAEAADPEHPARDWIAARSRKIRDHFATRFSEDIDDGTDGGAVDSSALAAVTLAVIQGLESQWLIDPEGLEFDRALAAYEALVLAYLHTRAGAPRH